MNAGAKSSVERARPLAALRQVLCGDYLRRALVVALLVGTALNVINQPEALLGASQLVWWKLLLTYLVPFCVATYGAYAAVRQQGVS